MTHGICTRLRAWTLMVACSLGSTLAAGAQELTVPATLAGTDQTVSVEPTVAPRPSLLKPFTSIPGDIWRLPSANNVNWLIIGMAGAIGAHTADTHVTDAFGFNKDSFKPGAVIGGTPLELGAAFATYAIGRSKNNPRVMAFGDELIRAQLVAELVTVGIKQAVRRPRPEGTGYSFPSGHTAVSFASATVIQKHFGWKYGGPAFAVASYVAASRVEMRRHYLSDVAFGAAMGIMAGRTVTIGGGRHLTITPTVVPKGGGVEFSWNGKP